MPNYSAVFRRWKEYQIHQLVQATRQTHLYMTFTAMLYTWQGHEM